MATTTTTYVADFTLDAADIVYAQINNDNACELSATYATFGVPTALATGAARNTSITLIAVAGAGFEGTVTVEYNRIDLTVIPGVRSTLIQLPAGATLISDMLPAINTAYGINLAPTDIVDGALATFVGTPNEKHDFTLVMAAGALVYTGSLTLTAFNDGTSYVQVTNSQGLPLVDSLGNYVVKKNPGVQTT